MSDKPQSQLLYKGSQKIEVGMPHGMITNRPEVKFLHVHDCAAALEERPCQFEWADHTESARCACGPTLDETNLPLNGTVFVVHQGVC
jgi:hypothetical protein